RDSPRTFSTIRSCRSHRRRPRAWAWGCPFAGRSSRPTAVSSGSREIREVRSCISPFRWRERIKMVDLIHVALIDDDAAVRDSLQLFLTRRHLKVTCFETAKHFLKARDGSEPFHCIVTDVRMPGMSGLDLVNYLVDRGWIRPIIVITGHGDVDMAVSAGEGGAVDLIGKPVGERRPLPRIPERG